MGNAKKQVSDMEKDYLTALEYSLFLSSTEVTKFYEVHPKTKAISAP
jgi:hypothetical protein